MINSKYKKEEQNLAEYIENGQKAINEKEELIQNASRDAERAAEELTAVQSSLKQYEKIHEKPIFQDSSKKWHIGKFTTLFSDKQWTINYTTPYPFDYEHPVEHYNQKDTKKTIIKADSNTYNVSFTSSTFRIKKVNIEVALYTWKMYHESYRSVVRTDLSRKKALCEQIEEDQQLMEKWTTELDMYKDIFEKTAKIKQKALSRLETERENALAEIQNLRQSLSQSKAKLEMKKQELIKLQTEQTSQRDRTKADINAEIQEINAIKIGLNNRLKLTSEARTKQLHKIQKAQARQRQHNEETLARLAQFAEQLKENQRNLHQNADILKQLDGTMKYKMEELNEFCQISDKMEINELLIRHIKNCCDSIKQAEILKQIYKCESLNQHLFNNTEIEPNVWIMNNLRKEKQSLFSFLQEIESDITLCNKWAGETELFYVRT